MATNITLLDNLQEYYLSGNLPDIVYLSSNPIGVTITLDRPVPGETIEIFKITDIVVPINNQAILRIKELLHNELINNFDQDFLFEHQTGEKVNQVLAAGIISIEIPGDISVCPKCLEDDVVAYVCQNPDCGITIASEPAKSFRIIKGSLALSPNQFSSFDFSGFLKENILTMGPQIRHVGQEEPCIISFYPISDGHIKVKSSEGTEINYEPVSGSFAMISVDVEFKKLGMATSDPEAEYFDVWMENTGGSEKTHPIRLVASNKHHQYSDFFLFESALGGLDTIRFTGVLSEIAEHEYLAATILRSKQEYATILQTIYEKNTGIIADVEHMRWVMDFFASPVKYHFVEGWWRRVYIVEKETQITKGRINSVVFKFSYDYQYAGKLTERQQQL